jgi:hypothetical protein
MGLTMTKQLRPGSWKAYFQAITVADDAPMVAVEVIRDPPSARIGDPQRRLLGIDYDPTRDLLQVALGGRSAGDPISLRHFISDPETIEVEGGDLLEPQAILIGDASGTRTCIRLFHGPTSTDAPAIEEVVSSACSSQRASPELGSESSG